jgi:hypothetical protein
LETLTQNGTSNEQVQQVPKQTIGQNCSHAEKERFHPSRAALFIRALPGIDEDDVIFDSLGKQSSTKKECDSLMKCLYISPITRKSKFLPTKTKFP